MRSAFFGTRSFVFGRRFRTFCYAVRFIIQRGEGNSVKLYGACSYLRITFVLSDTSNFLFDNFFFPYKISCSFRRNKVRRKTELSLRPRFINVNSNWVRIQKLPSIRPFPLKYYPSQNYLSLQFFGTTVTLKRTEIRQKGTEQNR